MKRIACSGIGIALCLSLFGLAAAQTQPTSSNSSQDSSLADYARQTRKSASPAKPKVFDNDNLPTGDKVSVIGQPAAPDTPPEAKPADTPVAACTTDAKGDGKTDAKAAGSEPGKPGSEDEDAKRAAAKQWDDKIDAQKEQIDLLARELDVLQREYQLRAAAMYGDAGNRLRNQGDWDKQDAQYKQQIADKQKALDEAKEKLDDLQEQARKAGATPPTGNGESKP